MIDGAINTAYAIYAASDDEFSQIFPGTGQDIEFVEDFIERAGEGVAARVLAAIWDRSVDKKSVEGIHGTLFYQLTEKRKFYESKREPVIDWKLVD